MSSSSEVFRGDGASRDGYGQVDVTGTDTVPLDGLSYDIFAQTSMAVRNVPALLGGLPVQKVIGAGMSQSGMRLGVYLNYLHMRAPVYDAFLIQVMNPVLRDDLTTPVIKVLSDTEATPVQLSIAQEDTATRRSWWVAGSSDGDTTQRLGRTGVRIRDLGLANTPNDSCAGAPTPMRSRVPLRHVVSAAIDALQRQITDGTSGPSAPPLAMDFGNFAVSMARDEHGNARGGVRGWGRADLGTRARGRGARTRRALMSTTRSTSGTSAQRARPRRARRTDR